LLPADSPNCPILVSFVNDHDSERLDQFLARPIVDLLGMTPALRDTLEQLGIKDLQQFSEANLQSSLIPDRARVGLLRLREPILRRIEELRSRDLISAPLPPTAIPLSSMSGTTYDYLEIPVAKVDAPTGVASPMCDEGAGLLVGHTYRRSAGPTTVDGEPLRLDWDTLLRHVFVAGSSGSGKTVFAKSLIEQAAVARIPSVIIDPGGDLGFLSLRPAALLDDVTAATLAGELAVRYPRSVDPVASVEAWAGDIRNHVDRQQAAGMLSDEVAGVRDLTVVRLYGVRSDAHGIQLALPPFDSRLFRRIDAESQDDYESRLDELVELLLRALRVSPESLSQRLSTVIKALLKSNNLADDVPLKGLLRLLDSVDTLVPSICGVPLGELLKRDDIAVLRRSIVAYLEGTSASWLRGVPFDLTHMCQTYDGQTPINVICISHLDAVDQQYVVARVASEIDAWMKRTSSHSNRPRLIFYIDELGGGGGLQALYPPVARPQSKPPLQRLIKQARKYGVSLLLASQNVKDIDYQGLTNISTWTIGRITTAREQNYIRDGIARTAIGHSAVDHSELGRVLPGLRPGMFVHVGPDGRAARIRARYLASIHARPIPEFAALWKSQFLESCRHEAANVVAHSTQIPRVMCRTGVFEAALFAEFEATAAPTAGALSALTWLLEWPGTRQLALNTALGRVQHMEPPQSLQWVDVIVNSEYVSEEQKDALRSLAVVHALRNGQVDAGENAIRRIHDKARRNLWLRFLDVLKGWSLPKEELDDWRVADSASRFLHIAESDLEIVEPDTSLTALSAGLRHDLIGTLESLPTERLLEIYRQCRHAAEEVVLPPMSELLDSLRSFDISDAELALLPTVQSFIASLSPIDFEAVTANFLRASGFETELTRYSSDGGVDVLAKAGDGSKCAVQCKRFRQDVGPAIVRELEGARRLYTCEHALLVTSSGFTTEARRSAAALGIQLMDGHSFAVGLVTIGGVA
jgi:DNA helicase HerA-like ATPase